MRVHVFFPLLVWCSSAISGADGWPRGFGPVSSPGAAVAVRETARLLVAAWLGLRLRAVLLLPIGGLFAYANPESQENANQGSGQFALALAGPLANLVTALAAGRHHPGRQRRYPALRSSLITSAHLLRSMVWMQASLGLLHLSARLSARLRPPHPQQLCAQRTASLPRAAPPPAWARCWRWRPCSAACCCTDPWLILAGFFIMIGAQIEDQGVFFQSVVDTVRMREVMLTDFATLSPSDTLADALVRCVHSLQEDFPVVRGPQLVGIVSRQRIVDALRNDGNGYVQSVMSRAFQVARPEDTLGTTIRRLTAGHGLALIPVTESGRVVGIVSVQNLMSSMSLLAEQRRIEREEASEAVRTDTTDPMDDERSPKRPLAPGLYSSPRPSATWATSRCAPSTCCAAWTASPAKTPARRKSCSIISRSRRRPSAATSTTSAGAPRTDRGA